jgi:5-formyltetrahydrofolate cyclo-ligase
MMISATMPPYPVYSTMAYMDAAGVKSALREQLQQRRESLSLEARARYSEVIVQQLISTIDWGRVRHVHSYVPMANRAEVDTWLLLRYIWRRQPRIQTLVPGPIRSGHPVAFVVDPQTVWRKTSVMPYPQTEEVASGDGIDLIIVPMLGFDRERYRLGYGSGYYDRFLAEQSTSHTIGISFSCGFVAEGLPHEQHDIALRQVVTESEVYA